MNVSLESCFLPVIRHLEQNTKIICSNKPLSKPQVLETEEWGKRSEFRVPQRCGAAECYGYCAAMHYMQD